MYIVTGGAGFLGSSIVWYLNKQGIDNIIIVDNLADSSKWKNLVSLQYVDYLHKDVFMNALRSKKLPFSISAVIHMGASSSTTETNADYLMENNFHYSQDLCRYTLELGKKFINASSAATYGDGSQGFSVDESKLYKLKPLNMYGYSKHLFDLWLLREQLLSEVVSLKFFNVYGPNEYHKGDMSSVIFKAFHQIKQSGKLKLFKSNSAEYTDGGQKRDFVYVKDCAKMVYELLSSDICGIRNVGTGLARSWNDLANSVFNAMDYECNIDYIDMPKNITTAYQNYTQADMSWNDLVRFCTLEEGINDYIKSYLLAKYEYLEYCKAS